jgi:hypothetical protein
MTWRMRDINSQERTLFQDCSPRPPEN